MMLSNFKFCIIGYSHRRTLVNLTLYQRQWVEFEEMRWEFLLLLLLFFLNFIITVPLYMFTLYVSIAVLEKPRLALFLSSLLSLCSVLVFFFSFALRPCRS